MFVVFDGIDGSGKTTQLAGLAQRLRQTGRAVTTVRDPGGSPLGQRLRELLLTADPTDPMTLTAEVLILFAARAQAVETVIRPALARGEIVLGDRFVSATLAYQGAGGGYPRQRITQLAAWTTGDLRPDRTLIFDLPDALARERLTRAGRPADRIEARGDDYFARVAAGYRQLLADDPAHYVAIPAAAPPEVVAQAVWAAVAPLLEARAGGLSSP